MTLRDKLDRFIHHPVVDGLIMVLIIISVVLTIIDLTRDPVHTYDALSAINDVLTVVFVFELTIRYYVARSKKRFFGQYWIDILSVLPWMRSLRVLRVLRLLRIFRMGLILNRRLSNVSAIFRGAGGEYMIIAMIIVISIVFGAVGMRMTEGHVNPQFGTLSQSAWWAVLSIVAGEPIGGEPSTVGGRIFTLLVMLSGLTVFAMFTGTVSAVMVNRLRNLNLKDMDIDDLRNHTVLCGWNGSGHQILRDLTQDPKISRRGIVLVCELDELPPLKNIPLDSIFFVSGDYTQMETLRQCGVPEAGVAILLADRSLERSDQDRDARTVLAAITIERMNPEIFTSVELKNRENGTFLSLMGVEEIVVAEEYTGSLIAMASRHRGLIPMIDELLTTNSGNAFFKASLPDHYIGKPVNTVEHVLRTKHNAILFSLENPGAQNSLRITVNPATDLILEADTTLIVIATTAPKLT